ncbi:MAG TPA: hypothetical protein VFC82_05185 [Actinomycetaceae bacterium]|nr:hypothetical protein [Actinomycetaceae bacterium]
MSVPIAADYLVVGAGVSAMAFVDSLIDHADGVRVVMVDRRHGPGGHWLDSYPFVRLHQASVYYGVASTMLGDGRIMQTGPEAGQHERATAAEICAYCSRVMEGMLASGKVEFYPNCEYVGGRRFISRLSGRTHEVAAGARLVNSSYLSPDIPRRTKPPFAVGDGARVIPANELVDLTEAPGQYVVVGAGKTATDTCVWLLENGVDPDGICWLRPRDPWMFNRAALQPDPAKYFQFAAHIVMAAAAAESAEDMFFRLEDFGSVLRIDPSVNPTMAKTPTIAQWEIDILCTVENVLRLGHLRRVEPGRLFFATSEVEVAKDAVVVHCAASGLKYRPVVPIWSEEAITLQPVRAGFPCFGAALTGYVEATRIDDADKNRVCRPSPLSDTPTSWARMQVMANRASQALAAEPDVREWAHRTTLNPGRVPPERAGDSGVAAALEQFKANVGPGMARMAEFAELP